MDHGMKFVVAAIVIGLSFCPAASRADTGAGLQAFQEGRFAEALEEWRQAAAMGDARGALFTGVMYDTGIGATQDYAAALSWYQRAAAAGSAPGAFNAGVMYDAGLGVAPDPAKAAKWYAQAASMGFGRAAYALGLMYESGSGVPQDKAEAVRLFQQAAAHGIPAAERHLPRLRLRASLGVRQHDDPAMEEFKQAQQVLLNRGAASATRATDLFRRAAEGNNPLAAYDLAYCYEHGIGVAPSRTEAYNWYRRAADNAADPSMKSIALAGVRNIESQLSEAEHRQSGPGR